MGLGWIGCVLSAYSSEWAREWAVAGLDYTRSTEFLQRNLNEYTAECKISKRSDHQKYVPSEHNTAKVIVLGLNKSHNSDLITKNMYQVIIKL